MSTAESTRPTARPDLRLDDDPAAVLLQRIDSLMAKVDALLVDVQTMQADATPAVTPLAQQQTAVSA